MKLNSKKNLLVAPLADKLRLDIFISTELGITRSQAQKLIEQGQVLVNGKPPKKTGQQVKKGDILIIAKSEERTTKSRDASKGQSLNSRTSLALKQGDRHAPPASGLAMTPKIIAETSDYIVVEKPTGMLTHATMAEEKNTLVDFMLKKYPDIKKVGDDPTIRPGIVHRLDKEASGLLVVARTQKMFNHLKEQFKKRTIEKEYYALAHGKVAKDWDEITFPIARGKTHDRMAARPLLASKNVGSKQWSDEENAVDEDLSPTKDARTEFLVEKRFVNFALLRVILHTGRMHQIRVHLLAYNHPLVGDPLYFQKKRKKMWDEKLGRLFLHSTKLSFTDLEGQRQTFKSPLPEELKNFLKRLR